MQSVGTFSKHKVIIPLKTPVTSCCFWEGRRQVSWQNGSKLAKFCSGGQRRGVLFDMCLCFRKCDVVNRGLSGYNTRWAKLILPRLISKSTGAESTVAVTIFFGANDSALKGTVFYFFFFCDFLLRQFYSLAEKAEHHTDLSCHFSMKWLPFFQFYSGLFSIILFVFKPCSAFYFSPSHQVLILNVKVLKN